MPDDKPSVESSKQFLSYIQQRGATLRDVDTPPKTLKVWEQQKRMIRRQLQRSWGKFPSKPCPLVPRKMGELKRDGYRVEKIVIQTRPGILMTTNAYVPDGEGKKPAVLCVHGHWRGAKQDPVVQSRCIGLAKLGFFVLVVDAFGAGERGLGKALGEYHGEMVGATLYPAGIPLSGQQVYENMRAVDYLQSRPEVDGTKIGITGASGGGNQTMYAGAFDERIGCVVPTCSVGTYQAYLGAACCMCEVVPNAMTYTEEWGLLAMVAPRGLMLINATRDAFQFSVGEAKKSLTAATKIFDLYEKPANAKHAVFESPHAYNQPMREAMYGWMTLHLKGEGKGDPIPEPTIKTEEPEALRCFPGESRPDMFVTIPQYAAAAGRKILAQRKAPVHAEHWETDSQFMLEGLKERVLGKFPRRLPIEATIDVAEAKKSRSIAFDVEPGISVSARQEFSAGKSKRLAVILDLEGLKRSSESELAKKLREENWDVITADLRGTGATAYARDSIGRAPDHNTAEWSMWTGRPLLGHWVWDVTRLLDVVDSSDRKLPEEVVLIGQGPAGVVAMCSAALDQRISKVATVGTMASYVTDEPYEEQRMGIIAPGILRDAGDIPHLAALSAPRRLIVAGSVTGSGKKLDQDAMFNGYEYTRQVYQLNEVKQKLTLTASNDAKQIVELLG